jgi:hypothetical protein
MTPSPRSALEIDWCLVRRRAKVSFFATEPHSRHPVAYTDQLIEVRPWRCLEQRRSHQPQIQWPSLCEQMVFGESYSPVGVCEPLTSCPVDHALAIHTMSSVNKSVILALTMGCGDTDTERDFIELWAGNRVFGSLTWTRSSGFSAVELTAASVGKEADKRNMRTYDPCVGKRKHAHEDPRWSWT